MLPTHGAFLDPKMETLELSPIERDPVLIDSPDTFLSHDPGARRAQRSLVSCRRRLHLR